MRNYSCPHRYECPDHGMDQCDQCAEMYSSFWKSDACNIKPKKKMILVGVDHRGRAFNYMNDIISNLTESKVDITYIDHAQIRFETTHTKVWFIFSVGQLRSLDGIRADAVFREAFPEIELRMTTIGGIISRSKYCVDLKGLVDYICRVERMYAAAQKVTDALYDNLGIKKAIVNSAVSEERWQAYYNHCVEPFTSESRRARELGEALHAGFTIGMNHANERRVTDTWVGDMWPKMYITMPPRNGKSLYRHMMNSLYGKFPERPSMYPYIFARGNGKSWTTAQWVQAVFDEAVKNGTVKTSLTKFRDISSEDIEQILKQSDHLIQQKLYAALMKGENTMPTREERTYIHQDVASLVDAIVRNANTPKPKLPGIKTVHFSGPVTAVIWEDKTKTIVRCKDGEEPDYEKGLAMAIAKKALGTNKSGSNYYDIFKKWLPKPEAEEEPVKEENQDG